jgi:hypothetical protein
MPAIIRYIDLEERGLIRASVAREILGISVGYLERLVQMGKLRPIVFSDRVRGRDRFYDRKEVEKYKREHPRLGTRKNNKAAS